jgi:uncharacterized protein YcaQ
MSADVARRVALGAQGFADSPPTGAVTKRHLQRAMGRMNVVQLDSIPIVTRTQYLTFHSRLGPYDPLLFDRVAYKDDAWFEAWSHEASLLPVASEPLFRWMRERAKQGQTWKNLHEVSVREPGYVQSVLDEVRERGAVTGGQLSDPRPLTDDGSGWWHRSLGVMALDWLFRVGELGVRRQGNFEKVFSPIETIIPADVLALPTPSEGDALTELIVQSTQGLGVGTAEDIADYFRLPIRDVRSKLPEVVEEGRILLATVRGWPKAAFADPHAKTPREIQGSTVLSPFDPVVWFRDRAARIWDFEYRIEIYVPAAQRRWGYYVLPVMIDGQLVARLDVKTDREAGVLRIQAAHAESGSASIETASRVNDAVEDLARMVGVEAVEIVDRGDLSPYLQKVR